MASDHVKALAGRIIWEVLAWLEQSTAGEPYEIFTMPDDPEQYGYRVTVERIPAAAPPVSPQDEVKAARERADAKREVLSHTRMSSTADVMSLQQPSSTASLPFVSDICFLCDKMIGEMESWRPCPDSSVFRKVHTDCLRGAGVTSDK